MHVAALILLAIAALALVQFACFTRGGGPEGPVGAHMVTGPFAILAAVALGLGLASGVPAAFPAGLPGALALPGLVVGLTALPITALSPRHRTLSRLGVLAPFAGGFLLFAEPTALQIVGCVGVLATSLVGYGMLLALFVQNERNRARAAVHEREQMDEFAKSQAAYQLGEWRKLPVDAELWQLIQFTHGFHPGVTAECHARIAALPGLEGEMKKLLGTGWAEHSLSYLRDHYPLPLPPLVPELTAYLDKQCDEWRESLRGTHPGSWWANLQKPVAVAARCAAQGGDLRAVMGKWAAMLKGQRGLEGLHAEAARLAAGR